MCWLGADLALMHPQVAQQLGDTVKILKVDTDENPELSSQLQVRTELASRCTETEPCYSRQFLAAS